MVDVKGLSLETPEDVAERSRRILKRCPADQLYVNPDCGFDWSPRAIASAKLRALAAGARLVRGELSGA